MTITDLLCTKVFCITCGCSATMIQEATKTMDLVLQNWVSRLWVLDPFNVAMLRSFFLKVATNKKLFSAEENFTFCISCFLLHKKALRQGKIFLLIKDIHLFIIRFLDLQQRWAITNSDYRSNLKLLHSHSNMKLAYSIFTILDCMNYGKRYQNDRFWNNFELNNEPLCAVEMAIC